MRRGGKGSFQIPVASLIPILTPKRPPSPDRPPPCPVPPTPIATTHPPHTSPALAVVGNENAGTDTDKDYSDNDGGELAEATGIWNDPFPPLLIPKTANPKFTFQLPMSLLPHPPSSPSSPSSPNFLLSSFPRRCRRSNCFPWICLSFPPAASYDVISILTLTFTRTSISLSTLLRRRYPWTYSCRCSRGIFTSILT